MGLPRHRPGGFAREDGGQTVVLVALMFTLLLGFTALAFDVGRFYAERRTLQDAVDAAALACARAYSLANATSATAYAAAEDILENYNLKGSLSDLYDSYQVPAQGSETYYDNIVTGQNLKNGVLPQTSPYTGCRVAVYIEVPTTLIQIANPSLTSLALNARAYAIAKGGVVPVVVPKYSNGPGPGNGDVTAFIHHTMASGSDYQCSVSTDTGCTAASTASKGREFVLFGASQKATNDNSFRGYIAPDIRDFQSTDGSGNLVHTAYNGVAANASINTLKDFEATWIREGYPGPDICTVSSTSFLPCAEIAVINGASAGIFVPEIEDRYVVGQSLLAQLYDGTVKTIPNFTISYPTLLIGSATQSVANQNVQFTFSSQYAQASFTTSQGQVTTTFYPDNGTITGGAGDATNPWVTGNATAGTFSVNPTPVRSGASDTSYAQVWSGITTTNAPKGIYAVFLKGQSGEPYPSANQLQVVTVNIEDQKKQFFIDTSDTYVNAPSAVSATQTVTYTARVTDGNGQQSWNGGSDSITLKIDTCPTSGAVVTTCFFGTTSPGTQTVTTNVGGTATLTVQIPGGTPDNLTLGGWIRAYGTDGESPARRVTRVLQIRTGTNVTTGGTTDYVDVLGFAVFEVTYIDSNDVKGKAITGWKYDINDPALAMGKKYGLVPWETN